MPKSPFMGVLHFILFLLLPLSLWAQEFRPLSLRGGQIRGITYITEGTEKTARPIIWVHGIMETSERWKDFMKAQPGMNHYAVNLPMHGIGDEVTMIKGSKSYKDFYEITLPEIIEHVYKTTGQRPVVVGFSLGAKTVHDSLVRVPGLADKVDSVVELLRPNQIGGNIPLPKQPLKIGKPILSVLEKTPIMPNISIIRNTSANMMPGLPNGIYTHLEGTELHQVRDYLGGLSTHVGNEITTHFIDEMNMSFTHTDHGKPTWFVWADNDIICSGGEEAFKELVKERARAYVLSHPDYKLNDVVNQVLARKFPPGFSPLYGTNLGAVGHLGATIPGTKGAKFLEEGVMEMAKDPNSFMRTKEAKFVVSEFNGIIGCAKNGVMGILSRLLDLKR